MKNATNQIKYKLLSVIYDKIMRNRWFHRARKKAFSKIEYQEGQKVLLVGVGTGLDIPLLPENIAITGIDLSLNMLAKAKQKGRNHTVFLKQMNAEQLEFNDHSFDIVVLNLILSVVENPKQALAESIRVVKKDGVILVFDKFLNEDSSPKLSRKFVNRVTSFLGTDINRKFSDIQTNLPLHTISDERSILKGNYRIILLQQTN
ncbi:class I SAM-dependent methyltransferase [Terrilactibacillus laevilacticus]|uniref:Class I SAM-dependent methyltransferase n=1 Tax=Terrilactibacillus laevilacticus TaxID=1380157 RepID=A0ABW5PNN6_9BACI|nr:class I SAM-dependent methyltransferase [Terrilactibacillus laevilacticus]